ncbi:MAG: hypothetical protein BGO41_11835 [Clostridiales bacterium 38-18]|nr:MAG: hypothetical protein BGO41_11835 [Clostridiales bacterium 38-18]
MKSIRSKVMTWSVSILILLIVILFFGAFHTYKSSIESTVKEAMASTSSDSAWHLSNFLDGYLAPLEKLAEDDVVKTMHLAIQKEVISLQINPNYENVAVIDLTGRAYYLDGSEIDLSDRGYIQEALKGKRSLSEMIISRKTGEAVIVAAVPIFNNDEVVGALIARLDMNLLKQYLSTQSVNKIYDTFIISDLGSIVMVSNPNLLHNLDCLNMDDLISEDRSFKGFSDIVKASSISPSGESELTLNDEDYFTHYEAIPNTNWKIYITMPRSEITNKLRSVLLILIGIAIIISIGTILFTWNIIKKYTAPILELDRLMEKGSSGDFNVYFNPTSEDEISRLGISFNRLMDKIKTLTYYDPVTQALNRNVFKNSIRHLCKVDQRNKFTLIMIIVNDIKILSETKGFEYTDSILNITAERIRSKLNEEQRLYRFDSDTLVVTSECYEHQSQDIEATAHHILQLIQEPMYLKNGYEVNRVKASMGIYHRCEEREYEDPIMAVTVATKYAHQIQADEPIVFDSSIHRFEEAHQNLIVEIYNGIKNDEFVLYYQPLFNLDNREFAKQEALIRWHHPKHGLLYPDAFIEIAEKFDAIVELDYWVIENACKTIAKWQLEGRLIKPVSVNVTAKTFENNRFIEKVEAILRKYNIPVNILEFEITERVVIKEVEKNVRTLHRLKRLGIKTTLDDFGIGYSSLSYLINLPIDSVKIDRSFIEQMSSRNEAKSIVSAIINLCQSIDLLVVAEGIENYEEYEYLKNCNCEIGQGYYFSKPLTLDTLEQRYLSQNGIKSLQVESEYY